MGSLLKLFGAVVGAILTLLIVSAGPLVWWYDRRPVGENFSITLPVPFWHPSLGLPESLQARLTLELAAYQEALERAQEDSLAVAEAQDQEAKAITARDRAMQAKIVTRTVTLTKEIHDVLPAAADAEYPLPTGLVLLHDAAATGAIVPPVSFSTTEPGGAPSPVKASDLAAVIVANYGECLADQQRLRDIQALWATDKAASDAQYVRNPP